MLLAGLAIVALRRGAALPATTTPAATAPAPAAAVPAQPLSPAPADPEPSAAAPEPATREGHVAASRAAHGPAQGSVRISSQPPGAQVSIDGRSSGSTPLTSTVEAGPHTILIVHDGHLPWSADVSIARGRTTTVDAQLLAVAPPAIAPSPEEPDRIYGPGEVDTPPEKIALDSPVYPRSARPLRKGQTLSVTLSYVVAVDGSTSDVNVVKSSGVRVVDEAVVAAALKSRYRPGTKAGAAVPSRVFHGFSFRGG